MIRVLLMVCCTLQLWGYSDRDMDGVEDQYDQCPNTSLTELVNLQGCTIKNLKSPHHFELRVGEHLLSDGSLELTTSSLQLGYYYKKLSLQLRSSYFDGVDGSGQNDTYLGGYYQFGVDEDWLVRVGGVLILPTYEGKDNRLDTALSFYGRYLIGDMALLGGMSYTLIGDRERNATRYDNRRFYSLGVGYYFSSHLYSSLSYNHGSGIYNQSDGVERLAWFAYYRIDHHWFANLSYTKGLNDRAIDRVMGGSLGYYW